MSKAGEAGDGGTRQRAGYSQDDEANANGVNGGPRRTSSTDIEMPEKATHRPGISDTTGYHRFKHRFLRKGRKKVGVVTSLKNIAMSSWLNVFIVFIPLAWIGHFLPHNGTLTEEQWPPVLTFVFCLLAIMPLERLFEYLGTQMAFYSGKDLGDLIEITLNNIVEATLAIILLSKCEIKLLQSTIVGVIILHLLLIPGVSFVVGGSRVLSQELHPGMTELNHSLLTIGVLTLLLPVAFFSAFDRGSSSEAVGAAGSALVSDVNRDIFLKMSRGLAIILLVVYICSRIYIHNPPGDDNALKLHPDAPDAMKEEEEHLADQDPEVNQFVIIAVLAVTIAIMAATAEWLVDSIEFVRTEHRVTEEWFGLILLPLVSFSADGMVSIVYFISYLFRHFFKHKPTPPTTLAEGQAIDLSIQFTLFWMPFLVLLGWWSNKPVTLLFDLYEVCLAIGACFIVNYVTADAKTNWAEGMALLAFYLMIALTTWFYTGQPEIEEMSTCGSIAASLAEAANATSEAVGQAG